MIVKLTAWKAADPIANGLVGIMITISGIRVIKKTLWVFLELRPIRFHAGDVSQVIMPIPSVRIYMMCISGQ